MNLSIRHWLVEHYIEIPQIREFSLGQIAGVALRIVQDMEVKSLMPFDICTLVEVLELPLGAVWQEITVIAQITQSLVSALSQKKPLKRNEGTWLTFQIAYLQALRQVLDQEKSWRRPWLDRAMIWNAPTPPQPLQDAQLQGLLKTLRPGKLTDTQAEQALSLLGESLLVQQMNNAAVAWFIANGAEEPEAKLLTQRLVNALGGYLLAVIAENAPPLAQLQKFFRLGNSLSPSFNMATHTPEAVSGVTPIGSTVGDKIDLYRELYRASLLSALSEPLLMESFTLKDIYVPLKGLPIEEIGSQPGQETVGIDLMAWTQQQLADLETIAVIESEPGGGKTSFCQIWAAKVAQELYPTWMPVLIRLCEVTVGKTLEESLNSAFKGHHTNLSEWLELNHPTKCLLLLDGLDELPPFGEGTRAKAIFIQQLLSFQSERRHKIVLTSQATTLQEIVKEVPLQLRRIAIEPWGQDELKLWFQQWAKVQSLPIAQNFFTFLKHAGVFSSKSKLPELSALVRQPLMLYLLGVLHRDGLLDDEILQLAASRIQNAVRSFLLWEINHRLSRWLLGYPLTGGIKTMLMRSGSAHIHRTQFAIANLLQGRHPQELLEKMPAVALQILHSQRYQINLTGESNLLPAFYFKVGGKGFPLGLVEFSHPKLGEYLCVQAIVAQLKALTQRTSDAYGELTFVLDSPSSVAQHLYNLLGYGILSQEIEELVIEGLRREQKREFFFEVLYNRLLAFWYAYCRGRWLDEGIANKALAHFQVLQNPVNVEQINAAVGLNVFLLLCASAQSAKVPFLPCGNPADWVEFNPEALMMLIGRTAVLGKSAFAWRIRSQSLVLLNLSGAYLPQVMLAGANLAQTNLSDTKLMGANLAGANLQEANLQQANLTGANLAGANLTAANLAGANLTGANLAGVNLNSVNFTNACLFQAILAEADKEIAVMNGAMFSLKQFQALKTVLSHQPQIEAAESAENTVAWSNNTPEIALIESAEGELVMPNDLYNDYADDETVSGADFSDYG